MNCDDIDSAIYVYLDGEFAELERADFERHLEGCPRCRRIVGREAAFLGGVRQSAVPVEAPSALRERIKAALDLAPAPLAPEAPRGSAQAPRWLGALGLAAAAVLLTLLWSPWGDTDARGVRDDVISGALAVHQTHLPMEVRGSERQIRAFLQDNVPFAVQLPFEDRPGVRLLGARLTRVDGRQAVHFNYEVDGMRLTVLQVADAVASEVPDRAPDLERRQGFDVLTYRRRGVTNSVVGSSSPAVHRLVRAAYQR